MLIKTFPMHLPFAFLSRNFLLCTMRNVRCHPLPSQYLSATFICTLHFKFSTYFEVLFMCVELSCPQTTAIFTINIKVSDDVVECYVDVKSSAFPNWCFAKWTFEDILNTYKYREAVTTAQMPTSRSYRLHHCQ